jgi:serine/threonine protein kinase/formylglycine-generating enzyme required for sulfatase activity
MNDPNRTTPWQPETPGSPSEHSLPPELPQQIGRYRVQKILGKGGFGLVYLAYDDQLDRPVAIKVPHRHRVATPEDAQAYLTEARTVANLDHPNIVPVHDVGRTEDCLCFVVSKFIEGCTLSQRLTDNRPAALEATDVVATVAEALHYAHKRGIVHRDIKPGNLLLDKNGKPFVADFGLALREQDVGKGPTNAGTTAYMSPEQARGEGHRVDGRSDIFSLGVVLYELLTGRRPFHASSRTELLEQMANRDVRPPRQWDDTIPKELERICIKALSKRASERYTTAKDMADDLRHFLASASVDEKSPVAGPGANEEATAVPTPSLAPMRSDALPVKIVPKGLRAFDAHDADFFLELLPGPRDRCGVPDSIRFWKSHLEETDPDRTFCIGLLYGPSGCGKSSLVKAGIMPRLAEHVVPVYVEALPDSTEPRLLRALRRCCPGLPDGLSLAESLAALRRATSEKHKVVLLIDQFEQWLHAHPTVADAELTSALRQCDGRHVQCVLMVRDDFWMSVTRLTRELEAPLLEGQNSAAADLFDLRHARKVLAGYGRAFGALAEKTTAEQERFLDRAVAELAQEGKVVPVRLALFAEMVKGKPWTLATLKAVGGTEGLGVAFFEEVFGASTAPPDHRRHGRAARAVLQALLPVLGSDIKGQRKSYAELLAASGYTANPADFDGLVRILDTELRLITPTDREASGPIGAGCGERYYQLSHDYLIAALRRWLTARRRETRQGRAELRLEEQAALWKARPQPRFLPSLLEWAGILVGTSLRRWTDGQRKMMWAATRHHLVRVGAVVALLVIVGVGGLQVRRRFLENRDAEVAESAVQRLLDVDTADVPRILPELDRHRRNAEPLLWSIANAPERPPRSQLHARMALLPENPELAESVADAALTAEPGHMAALAGSLRPYRMPLSGRLWGLLEDGDETAGRRLRAACLLAMLDPDSTRWAGVAAPTVADLAAENPFHAARWAEALRPAGRWLVPALADLFRSPATTETARSIAASALADYAAADTILLASLITDADSRSFRLLLPSLRRNREQAVALLTAELAREPSAAWDNDKSAAGPAPGPHIQAVLEKADGMLAEHFALAQTLPLAGLDALAAEMSRAGYRPSCLRPFATPDGVRAAVVWLRDGRAWDWIHGATPEAVRERDSACRNKGLLPADLAAYTPEPGKPAAFAALWAAPDSDLIDASLYVDVPDDQHATYWKPLNAKDFIPRTNLIGFGPDGAVRRSSVRWRLQRTAPEYRDAWDVDKASYARDAAIGWYQVDVRLVQATEKSPPRYAAVWWNGGNRHVTTECHGLSPIAHANRWRELAAEGLRPVTVSAAWDTAAGRVETASVWQRPVPGEEARDALARRQAAAAVALLQLGKPNEAWPLFRLRPDPRVRAWLIHSLAPSGTDPVVLVERLAVESEDSARRGLLLALAEYPGAGAAAAARLYRKDPDAGVHSAARFLLQKCGQQQTLDALEQEWAAEATGTHGWRDAPDGHTLAVIRGPVEFVMGSTSDEQGHDRYRELQRRVRIKRSYAIATNEVTLQQFLLFRPDHNFAVAYTPDRSCPATNVSWYDAVAYCRWLSERDHLPEDQMCYPPLDEIARCRDGHEPLRLPGDFVVRQGYRLPTEAEWEYACRATTETPRFFGGADALLPSYAWTINNSGYRASPVGRLAPNDFGLFDVLGNAMEWCHDRDRVYPFVPARTWEDAVEAEEVIKTDKRVRRGGAFLYQPSDARSAHRDPATPDSRYVFLGFRLARTVD